MTASEDIHRLLDSLPERELHAAKRFLEFLRDSAAHPSDPVLRVFFEAPLDDEPLTVAEAAAIQEGREEAARGEVIAFEEVFGTPGRTA